MVNFFSSEWIDDANKKDDEHIDKFNKFGRRVGDYLIA